MTDLVPVAERDTYSLIPMAADLAERLAKTDFVPSGLRGKPEAVMAAMLQGHEVGLPPMMSLSKIAVINGTPSMAAEAMRALVLSHGHEVWFEEKNTTKVTICGRRKDSDRVSKVTWTMDDAKRAGLAGKDGWRKYPRAYLTARCTSELCRDIFADVLGGISYTPEEVEDFDDDYVPGDTGDDIGGEVAPPAGSTRKAGRAVTKKAAKRGTARRQPPAAPTPAASDAPQPPLPGEDGYDDVLELPAGSVRETVADDTTAADDEDLEQPDTADEIDLPATLEQAGLAPAKFLREARRVAKECGEPQPTAVEEITDQTLIRGVLDDLGLAPVLSSTPVGIDAGAATTGRNQKMWAMVAEAWPDDNDESRDELRRTVIGVVSGGRTESSKTLNAGEWDDLFSALEALKDGTQELHLRATGEWELRRPSGRRAS